MTAATPRVPGLPSARSHARRSRLALRLWGVSLGVYLVGASVLGVLAYVGAARADWVMGLCLAMGLGLAGFFVVLRSSLWPWMSDSWLFSLQSSYALVCTTAAYVISGPARSVSLMAVTLILVFTMFSMNRAVQRGVAAAALVLFGGTMMALTRIDPVEYPPLQEAVNFTVLAAVTLAITSLGTHLTSLRERVEQQKVELSGALQRIQSLATRDELTGLVNRRHMQEVMSHEHQRCVRSGQIFCVAVLDLDHFKAINDRYGHPAGDAVLRAFAREAGAVIRVADVLGRWGGEEFLLLMSDTPGPLAKQGVERLRERTAAMRIRVEDTTIECTMSAGIAEHRPSESIGETIARADRALYAAKSEGRNRVVLW